MHIAYAHRMQDAYAEDATLENLINAWHEAVNRRDLDAARALVTDRVEVSGPRGTHSITPQEFADWIVASGIRLRPLSAHPVDAATMVVEQAATWPGSDTETTVATLFRAHNGALTTIRRFASLPEALHAATPPEPGRPG
jgi:hypothetical protein